MRTSAIRGKILTVKQGAWCCPRCGKKILPFDANARASELPVYCWKCKQTWRVNIVSGLCYLSPCPISQ